MPPSTKRSSRARKQVNKNLDKSVDVPDSSPSRPAKRRKKTEEAPVEPEPEPEVETEPDVPEPAPEPEPVELPKDRAGLNMNDEELVDAVVPYLILPEKDEVQASKDYANELHQQQFKDGVTAYAKLAGRGWTFYVTRLRNTIGRPPEGSHAQPAPMSSIQTNSAEPMEEDEAHNVVHIDLGPSKTVSRQHAEVYFDLEKEHWFIAVLGRNGIRINAKPLKRNERKALVSGQIIEVAGVEMMFVLPQGNLKIDRRYLERANLIAPGPPDEEEEEDETEVLPDQAEAISYAPHMLPHGQLGGQMVGMPIAPAPPNYQRPGTPSNMHPKPQFPPGKSPAYAGSTMLMNAEDVDLSLDSNQHIKPTFSYAQLISQAILRAQNERLTLALIYQYITDKYAYYRHQNPSGWQNSIRHNLSLNKSFEKVPRDTAEPGKGMKWQIVPEHRDEMIRTCNRSGRGGHRGSPGGSPGGAGLMRASKAAPVGDSALSRRANISPEDSGSPRSKSQSPGGQQTTPKRDTKHPNLPQDDLDDGTPLPRLRGPRVADNAPGSPTNMSSSFLPDDANAFVTPAPRKVHPQFGPASTAQRPSKMMYTSSPAAFWLFGEMDNTPNRNMDSSPAKGVAPSSSPAPARNSSAASPSRNGKQDSTIMEEDEDEDQGFDLTRGFQSIGSFHAAAPTNGLAVGGPLHGSHS